MAEGGTAAVPVVYAVDGNYLPYLKVSIRSLMMSVRGGRLDVIICHREISLEDQNSFLSGFTPDERAVIRFVSLKDIVDSSALSRIGTVQWLTQSSTYRLVLAQALPEYRKLIYLDADLLVVHDIRELYETDLRGNWLGAVRGLGYSDFASRRPDVQAWHRENGLPIEDYVNSGVLLMDTEAFRKHAVVEKLLIAAAANQRYWPDQDALNLVCHGHLLLLDEKWNVTVGSCLRKVEGHDGDFYLGLLENAYVLHFSASVKPWHDAYLPMAGLWRYFEFEHGDGALRTVRLNYFTGFRNFGDMLSALLVGRLADAQVEHAESSVADVMACGSLFGNGSRFYGVENRPKAKGRLHVWGSGFLNPINVDKGIFKYRDLMIHAVRGRESEAVLRKLGFLGESDHPVLGDPGLFYPDLVEGWERIPKVHEIALVPHHNDLEAFRKLGNELRNRGVDTVVVDVTQSNPCQVIREIASARKVLASSLHAIIAADAMGIPNRRLIRQDAYADKGSSASYEQSHFKFRDYYSAFGLPPPQALTVAELEAAPGSVIGKMSDSDRVPAEQVRERKRRLLAAFPGGVSSAWLGTCQRREPSPDVRLSIIIPAFSAEPFVDECLRSILLQGECRDLEVIAVDDGSDDGTRTILDRWARRDGRVRVLCQGNQGPGVARNAGMAVARGDYIAFLDADDRLTSGANLKTALDYAMENELDIEVLASNNGPDADGKWADNRHIRRELLPDKKVFAPEDVGVNLFQVVGQEPWAKLYRRDFVVANRLEFPALKRSEDFPFVMAALLLSKRIGALDVPLCDHRIGISTSLESTKDETPCAFIDAEKWFWSFVDKTRCPKWVRLAARASMVVRFAYNLHAVKRCSSFRMIADRLCNEAADLFEIVGECQLPSYVESYGFLSEIRAIHRNEDALTEMFVDVQVGRMLREKLQTRIGELQARIGELQAKDGEHWRKRKEFWGRIEAQSAQIKTLQARIGELEAQNGEHWRKRKEFWGRIEAQSAQIKSLQARIGELQAQDGEHWRKRKEFWGRIEAQSAQIKSLQARIGELQAKDGEHWRKRKEFWGRIEAQSAQIKSLQAQNGEHWRKRKEFWSRIEAQSAQIKTLQSRNGVLQKQNEEMRQSVAYRLGQFVTGPWRWIRRAEVKKRDIE